MLLKAEGEFCSCNMVMKASFDATNSLYSQNYRMIWFVLLFLFIFIGADQIGLTPEEVISKIMANPDVAMAFQNPRVQAAIMDVCPCCPLLLHPDPTKTNHTLTQDYILLNLLKFHGAYIWIIIGYKTHLLLLEMLMRSDFYANCSALRIHWVLQNIKMTRR